MRNTATPTAPASSATREPRPTSTRGAGATRRRRLTSVISDFFVSSGTLSLVASRSRERCGFHHSAPGRHVFYVGFTIPAPESRSCGISIFRRSTRRKQQEERNVKLKTLIAACLAAAAVPVAALADPAE